MIPRKFNRNLVLTCAFLLAVSVGVSVLTTTFPVILFIVTPAYAVLTYYLFQVIRRAVEKHPSRFVAAFMGAVTVKLLLTISFLTAYIYFFPSQKNMFAISVFVIYVAYTFLLVQELRRHNA